MRAFISAVIAAVIVAGAAAVVLGGAQTSADKAFSTGGARVGDPGHNLTGG